ncbi:unnamed protein product [Orchesella dallaii]|uniref:BTB domain-containing protein n=1 Tax=Orchesella dallaii TaxID=48710 RepID=A0ABP1Q155_9HEXA
MLLYLVKDFPLKVRRSERSGGEDSDNWTWTTWKTTFDIDLSTDNHDNGAIPIEYQQAYCRKMRDIMASDGTPMALTAILTWDHRTSYLNPTEMTIRLVGRILEKLSVTWEQPIGIVTEVYFRNVELMPTRGEIYRRSSLHPSLRPRSRPVLPHIEHTFDWSVKTKEMLIQPALVVTGSIPNQPTTEAEPFVEDDDTKLNCSFEMGCDLKNYWCRVLSGHTDRRTINIELSVYFVVDNDYLTEDRDALKHMSSTNRTILELGINSDVTIVTSNGAKVAAHKCFLSASSSVLAAMLSSDYFQECTSNNIKMVDASEQGVKCQGSVAVYLHFQNHRGSQSPHGGGGVVSTRSQIRYPGFGETYGRNS